MREKLITYVDFLFAGAPKTARTEEIKAEILQNTLDKFDDLVAEGKSPEAAYSLAVSGIGDIGELLTGVEATSKGAPAPAATETPKNQAVNARRAAMRSIAIFLYITCVLPPILFSDTRWEDSLGPALMFVMVAVATMLMVFQASLKPQSGTAAASAETQKAYSGDSRRELRKAVNSAVWTLGLAAYFIISFTTGAWHLTWLIFPVTGAVGGLVRAALDLTGVE